MPFDTEVNERDSSALVNSDLLVEMGLPRDIADKAVKECFEELDTFLTYWKSMMDKVDTKYPDRDHKTLAYRTLIRSLIAGGISNFLDHEVSRASIMLPVAVKVLGE